MTIIEALIIAAVLCILEARNCSKRAKLWDALAELENRKQSVKGEPHILTQAEFKRRTKGLGDNK